MLLKEKGTEHMVEVSDLVDLMNLNITEVMGRYQEGEEQQDQEVFQKQNLAFLSGENLPRCWTDPKYRAGTQHH